VIQIITYEIISTGSEGNAVVVEKAILIDCGVPFKALQPYYRDLKLVLLTHIHSDHFNRTCIRRLARERPSLRFACGSWLAEALVDCGVPMSNIDVVAFNKMYLYGICNVIPVPLAHNVPNCGWKIHFPIVGKRRYNFMTLYEFKAIYEVNKVGTEYKRMIYATDTNNLNGVAAKNYDLYLIEANYEDEIIQEKINQKKAAGMYAYEVQALKNHLSRAKAEAFIYANARQDSTYVFMHTHKEKVPDE
jgi:hypothetical protein